jgi:hypothetical protein
MTNKLEYREWKFNEEGSVLRKLKISLIKPRWKLYICDRHSLRVIAAKPHGLFGKRQLNCVILRFSLAYSGEGQGPSKSPASYIKLK